MSALSATPESGAPQENGTRIECPAGSFPPAHPARSPESSGSNANSHRPFRFSKAERRPSSLTLLWAGGVGHGDLISPVRCGGATRERHALTAWLLSSHNPSGSLRTEAV